jgi:hypothetical protein
MAPSLNSVNKVNAKVEPMTTAEKLRKAIFELIETEKNYVNVKNILLKT